MARSRSVSEVAEVVFMGLAIYPYSAGGAKKFQIFSTWGAAIPSIEKPNWKCRI
jgi:hypothetical protein